MVILKVVKSTQISMLVGVGKGSSYEIHTIMKMIELCVTCSKWNIQACTSQILSSTMSVGNCSYTDLVGRLPHHWEGGQMHNKTLSIIIIILSVYSNYRLAIAISNDF